MPVPVLVDLARQQLGWEQTVSLEQGLDPMIESFRSVLGIDWRSEAWRFKGSAASERAMWAARRWR